MTYDYWYQEIMRYRHVGTYRDNARRALSKYIAGVKNGQRVEHIPLAKLEGLLALVEAAETLPPPRRRRGEPKEHEPE